MTDITRIEISTGTMLRAILLVLALIFVYLIRDVVAVILFSVVVASAIGPAAEWFTRWHLPRVLGVLLIYIITFSVLGAAFSLIVPPLLDELSTISSSSIIEEASGAFFDLFPKLPISIAQSMKDLVEGLRISVDEIAGGFFKATSAIFGGAFSFILIV